jgi:hypothetical protein
VCAGLQGQRELAVAQIERERLAVRLHRLQACVRRQLDDVAATLRAAVVDLQRDVGRASSHGEC